MKVIIPMDIVSIQGDGYHLFIPLKIGRKKFRMLVDTGASRTVFDLSRMLERIPDLDAVDAERMSTGLGASGIAGKIARIGNLSFNGLKINNYHTMLLDMSHVNESYSELGLAPVDGVLGSDLMHQLNGIINYGKGSLTLQNDI
ncbi:MAG: clan AA aspartic protease [Bacteroidetes bacterium]|nr:clan AA aspartic protease [Bacteroidota bacterium]